MQETILNKIVSTLSTTKDKKINKKQPSFYSVRNTIIKSFYKSAKYKINNNYNNLHVDQFVMSLYLYNGKYKKVVGRLSNIDSLLIIRNNIMTSIINTLNKILTIYKIDYIQVLYTVENFKSINIEIPLYKLQKVLYENDLKFKQEYDARTDNKISK